MSHKSSYRHVQHAPLCLLLDIPAIVFSVLGLVLKSEPLIPWLFPPIGLLMFVLPRHFVILPWKIKSTGCRSGSGR